MPVLVTGIHAEPRTEKPKGMRNGAAWMPATTAGMTALVNLHLERGLARWTGCIQFIIRLFSIYG
jgi:hypothetical protein